MAGKNEVDIIDAAMSGDDFDYGDKPVDTGSDDTSGADNNDIITQREDTSGNDARDITQRDDTGTRQPTSRIPDTGGVPQGLTRVGPQFADGKGNIVDRSGKVLARAGEGARLWQEASRATAQVGNLQRQLDTATRKLQGQEQLISQANEIVNLPAKLGISREDYNEGVTLMSRWRADPVGVAKEVVARTLTFGYNVTDILGKTAGDALEMRGISQMIKEATAPLIAERNARTQTTEVDAKTQQAYQHFVDTHEHAETHAEAIANLMNNNKLPAVDAYYRVREFALTNQLDFTQPLGPQIAARSAGGNGQRQTPSRPLVNGSGNGRGSQDQSTTQPVYANADDTWGDILNSVLKE